MSDLVPPNDAPVTQPVLGSAGGMGLFIVLGVKPGQAAEQAVRDWCGRVGALARSMVLRYPDCNLRCVIGFGAPVWSRLFGEPRPALLHPFTGLRAQGREAPSTPGDVLIHIRAERYDVGFDLATRLCATLGDAAFGIDEVHGARAFDSRSILGFVDGTENPVGSAAEAAVFIGQEDADFAGGSYVLVQKYLHDMAAWHALPVSEQEKVIGRSKADDIEMADDVKPKNAHNALTAIEDGHGNELKIVRDNLPFGTASQGEFGTYFIGYCRDPAIVLRMLSNMFVGDPPGNYDRILDFSRPVTGTLFFVPSADLLEGLAERRPGTDPDTAAR